MSDEFYVNLFDFLKGQFVVDPQPDPVLTDGQLNWGLYCAPGATDPVVYHQTLANTVGSTPRFVLTFKTSNSATWLTNESAPLPSQIPVLTWEAFDTSPLDKLLAGAYDAKIIEQSKTLAALGRPVLFRPLHEMNGNWYPWSGSANGSNATATQKYRNAWIKLHGLVSANAPNVRFVWAVNSNSVPTASWNNPQEYYPGHEYVDYIGCDAYDFGNPSTSFSSKVSGWYSIFQWFGKPLLITETASADNGTSAQGNVTTGQNKAGWIDTMAADLQAKYPKIRAVIWFHINKERLWQIDSSQSSLDAFKRAV